MIKICFLTKSLEAIQSLICLVIHILGFLYRPEPLPHQFIFCGTFFAAFLVSLIGAISILIRYELSIIQEIFLSGFFFVLFLATAIVSMANAEKDIHLLFLTDAEEAAHPFFWINRLQSLLALSTAMIYLLHSIYCLDLVLITKDPEDIPSIQESLSVLEKKDLDALRPLKLRLSFANWFYSKFRECRRTADEEELNDDSD
ncbi:uncharacterized protein LOC129805041 [Phlebotomus papatasi]|uniref:uncharacterized protein LOC129805041 n=1 Tax=Phlebotomus papatasi TaxID=29031 RepID=UPI002483399E|nr:uncharacterized protein LOC129805041 [Phlebotomus papatasi]